jgi:outer membrane lipoprotein-sorting protein
MKKLISLMFVLVLVLSLSSLVACGGGGNNNEEEEITPEETTPAVTTPAATTPVATTPAATTPAATTPAATTPAATAPAGALTIDSKVSAILAVPGGEDILNACGIDTKSAAFQAAKVFSVPKLKELSANETPDRQITQAMVDCVDQGLQALAAGTLDAWLASKHGGPPAPTATTTPTSTSGKTLSDIYGGGKNLGDVKFDMVMTSPQMPQAQTVKAYFKNFGVEDQIKYRMDMTEEGIEMAYLVDYGTQTAYMWNITENTAYKMDMSQVPDNPTENEDQIHPTYIGTDTFDGHLCDVWQWTEQVAGAGTSTENVTSKVWVWKDKSFPVKMESTISSGTTTIEYRNIVFGTLSDSLFQLPAGVQITSMPGMGGTGGTGGLPTAMPTGVPTTTPCSQFQMGSQEWIDCVQQTYSQGQ